MRRDVVLGCSLGLALGILLVAALHIMAVTL